MALLSDARHKYSAKESSSWRVRGNEFRPSETKNAPWEDRRRASAFRGSLEDSAGNCAESEG